LTPARGDDIERGKGARELQQETFERRLARRAKATTATLATILGEVAEAGEIQRPARLMAAMRHAALTGGKRLRPFLLVETAAMFGGESEGALLASAAIECIHCYSLVHDDLPAMDDDDLRRGQPTVHRAYDEATAILAGDGLLTLAFDLVARPAVHRSPRARARLAQIFARAAGVGGMVGGQVLDLQAEYAELNVAEIERMQAMKTGALIRAACEAGAVLGGAGAVEIRSIAEFGAALGSAFQIADDLLDATSSADKTGKNTGKDGRRGKATLVSLLGIEAARNIARQRSDAAIATLASFGRKAKWLVAAARFAVERSL
jgi:farnesyl diphosphate synthase